MNTYITMVAEEMCKRGHIGLYPPYTDKVVNNTLRAARTVYSRQFLRTTTIRGHHIARALSVWVSPITADEFINGALVELWDKDCDLIYGHGAGLRYYHRCKALRADTKVKVVANFDSFCNGPGECALRSWCGKVSWETMCAWYKDITDGRHSGYPKEQHDYPLVDRQELSNLGLVESKIYTIRELWVALLNR